MNMVSVCHTFNRYQRSVRLLRKWLLQFLRLMVKLVIAVNQPLRNLLTVSFSPYLLENGLLFILSLVACKYDCCKLLF